MKRMAILAAVVAAGGLASGLYAQDDAPRIIVAPGWAAGANVAPGGTGAAAGAVITNGGPGGIVLQSSGAYSRYGQMTKVCNLSEEQQKDIKEIEAERDKATQAFYADNAEKMKAAKAALGETYKSNDKDAVQKAMSDYREMMAPLSEIQKSAHSKVMAVLAPEQKAAWQEYQVFSSLKAMFSRAKLTDEQMGKLKAVYADLAKDKDAKVEDITRRLNEQARTLLTDEQKEAMKATPWLKNVAPGATLLPGAPAGGAPNPAPGQPAPGQGGAWIQAPGASANGAVIVIGEGNSGAGGTIHIIKGQGGAVGSVEVHIQAGED
jgi:Spy/CpxP family protein refolding chaperone